MNHSTRQEHPGLGGILPGSVEHRALQFIAMPSQSLGFFRALFVTINNTEVARHLRTTRSKAAETTNLLYDHLYIEWSGNSWRATREGYRWLLEHKDAPRRLIDDCSSQQGDVTMK
jgi:hypothetical protein